MEINGKNYTPKYSLRSMFVFEEMLDKPFSISTLFDTYCFCYACIVSNQDNPALDFNEFIDYADQHPETIEEFSDYMAEEMKKRDTLGKKKTAKKVTEKS